MKQTFDLGNGNSMSSDNERKLSFIRYADDKRTEYYLGANLNYWTDFTMKSQLKCEH